MDTVPPSWALTRWITRTERVPRRFGHGDVGSGEDLHPISGEVRRSQIASTKYHSNTGVIPMVADGPLSQYPAFIIWRVIQIAYESIVNSRGKKYLTVGPRRRLRGLSGGDRHSLSFWNPRICILGIEGHLHGRSTLRSNSARYSWQRGGGWG